MFHLGSDFHCSSISEKNIVFCFKIVVFDLTCFFLAMLYSMLEKAAAQHPNTIALFSGNNNYSCTYYELNEKVKRLSCGLLSKGGVKTGDRIASYLHSCPEVLELMFACFKIGVTVVIIHPIFGENEIRLLIEKSQPKLFVTQSELYGPNVKKLINQFSSSIQGCYLIDNCSSTNSNGSNTLPFSQLLIDEVEAEKIRTIAPIPVEQEATIILTSGTTGRSKCVQSTHYQHLCAANHAASTFRFDQNDRFLCISTMNSGTAARGLLLLAVRCASTIYYLPSNLPATDYTKKLCHMIYEHNITYFLLTPSILRNILEEIEQHEEYCDQKNSLRYCLVGGEKFPQIICEKAKQIFGFYPTETYGMTEMNGILAIAADTPHSGRFKLFGDKKIRITDDNWNDLPLNSCGEITMWSTTVMTGYLNDEQATQQVLKDGWLKTGDLGILEATNETDVLLNFVGRKKYIVKCGEFNINLLELEETIMDNKAVFEVCVTSIPFKTSGVKPIAYVSLRSQSPDEKDDNIVVQEIFSYLKEKVASFKIPLHIKILEFLPKTMGGKIDRNTLAQRALDEFAA
jgi:acyl-CoA synthetase (AMP-forming)/AMP-acid ligase II